MALFRPSVQPFLISYFRYDPWEEIAKLEIPVLVLQGGADIQTGGADADALQAALRSAGKDAAVVTVQRMNHVLKEAETDQRSQMKAYTDPSLPLAGGLIEEIVRFIRALDGTRRD